MKHTISASVALSLAVVGAATADERLAHLPVLSEVAPDAVAISPHIPQMGVHWANPQDLPVGPIYCAIDGRIVCVEYMFLAEDLAAGTHWTGLLPGIQTPPIAHIDVEYLPEGVGPMPVPLYQLHIYFADKDVLAQH